MYDKIHYYAVILHQPDKLKLSSEFESAIRSLSTVVQRESKGNSYDWSPQLQSALAHLFASFGAHYFSRVHFGGYSILMAAIDDEYFFAQNNMFLLNRTTQKLDAVFYNKPEMVGSVKWYILPFIIICFLNNIGQRSRI